MGDRPTRRGRLSGPSLAMMEAAFRPSSTNTTAVVIMYFRNMDCSAAVLMLRPPCSSIECTDARREMRRITPFVPSDCRFAPGTEWHERGYHRRRLARHHRRRASIFKIWDLAVLKGMPVSPKNDDGRLQNKL